MEINAKINYKGLENLIKAMSKQYSVKVGLLANKGGSDAVSENMDLAGLGALQEFGADIKITQKMAAFLHFKAKELGLPETQGKGDGYVHIPARSWLQMPLERRADLLKKILAKTGDIEMVADYITKTGDMQSLAILVGASAVEQIQEAFNTEGFGEWAANSPYTTAQKGSAMPLVDTGSLRQAITYEVDNNG